MAGNGIEKRYKVITTPSVIPLGNDVFEVIKVSVPALSLVYIFANNKGTPPLEFIETYCSKFQDPAGIVVRLGSPTTVTNSSNN